MNAIEKEFATYMSEWKKENIDSRTSSLIAQANSDLYFGPNETSDDYPGFSVAVEEIRRALEDIVPHALYMEESGYVCDTEPIPEVDEETGEEFYQEYYTFQRKDILKALVGRELCSYL